MAVISWRSYADLHRILWESMPLLRTINPAAVTGIPRSGVMVATQISQMLDIPMVDLYSGNTYRRNRERHPVRSGSVVLLVDDSVNSGKAMQHAKEVMWPGVIGVHMPTLVVFANDRAVSNGIVDHYLNHCPGPRAFQWNWHRHKRLKWWAFDMDGVLCRDVQKGEWDDGPRYREFIARADPLYLPRRHVGAIVTSRLEKYRCATEQWLQSHGVTYDSLHMMDLPTKEARAQFKQHTGIATWKADKFAALNSELFIESSNGQASAIARISGKPVVCITNGVCHVP